MQDSWAKKNNEYFKETVISKNEKKTLNHHEIDRRIGSHL